jgi:hypothetical protein
MKHFSVRRQRRWLYHTYAQTIDMTNLNTANTALANRLHTQVLGLRKSIVMARYPLFKYQEEIQNISHPRLWSLSMNALTARYGDDVEMLIEHSQDKAWQ